MNEFDKNKKIETILEEAAEQVQPNVMFKAELEEKLRKAHKPRTHLQTFSLRNWLPALTGIVVVSGLVIFMVWLFKTLEPQNNVGTNEEKPIQVETTPGVIIDPNNTNSNETIGGYDYRGGKLFLSAPLPESPAIANVYNYIDDQAATIQEAQALASQFGLQGEAYLTAFPQFPDKTGYVISDGKRMLTVYTKNYFTYTPDILVTDRGYYGVNNENAETIISDFFKQNGLTFPFSISKYPAKGMYHFMQLAPDGTPMQYDIYTIQSSNVTLGQNGEVAYLTANMLSYDPKALGSYGIISAEDALNAILDPYSTVGMTESGSGGEDGIIPQQWFREYPNNETVSMYGSLMKYDSATPGQSPLIFVGSFEAIGNTVDLQALSNFAFVQVTGQFVEENGVRKFNVESTNANAIQSYITGSLRKEGDQIILASDDGSNQYILLDPPADLPLNTVPTESYLSVSGMLIDNTLDWSNIQYIADASGMGGGGGGGGLGFYPLNLSGTPAIFPTPVPAEEQYSAAEIASFLNYIVEEGDTLESIATKFNVSLNDLMRANYITDMNVVETGWLIKIPGVPGPTQLTGEEGIVNIMKYIKPDGRVRYQYTFLSSQSYNGIYYELQGDNLETLQNLVNRPVKIWGDISYSDTGTMFLDVKKYEEVHPGLQFQILQGKETFTQLNGKPVALFTTDGNTYVMLSEVGAYQDLSYKGDFPEEISIEALLVPGETYEGMPALRLFSMSPAKDPNTGEAIELKPFAGEIQSSQDPFGNSDVYVEPDFIVDSVKLEYYVTDPKMLYDAPTTDKLYIQPVWHFSGHYTNGAVSDILVQALKQEYLYPFNSP
ncbi:MAG: LysM domain-containing protein [Anaerolineales bacterium]